jgi:hypothetical protein
MAGRSKDFLKCSLIEENCYPIRDLHPDSTSMAAKQPDTRRSFAKKPSIDFQAAIA